MKQSCWGALLLFKECFHGPKWFQKNYYFLIPGTKGLLKQKGPESSSLQIHSVKFFPLVSDSYLHGIIIIGREVRNSGSF